MCRAGLIPSELHGETFVDFGFVFFPRRVWTARPLLRRQEHTVSPGVQTKVRFFFIFIMTTRKANNSASDTVSTSTSSSTTTTNHQTQPRSRSPSSYSSGVPASDAAGGGAEMFGEFQDWCLRTYGDSGKTKTVTRRKYNKILQTLLQGDEENSHGVFLHEKGNNHINAKFKFWVKSKGFQVGTLQDAKNGASDRPVLFVPIKATVSAPSSLSVSCVRDACVRACPPL